VSIYITFIVLGLAAGAVYVVLGNALLVNYRATGVINFAQAALGLWCADTFVQLRTSGSLVLPIGTVNVGAGVGSAEALAIALGIAAVLGLITYWLIFRVLRRAPTLAQVVASVALLITMEALVELRFGANGASAPTLGPSGTWTLGKAVVNQGDIMLGAIAIVLSVLTWIFLHHTGIGIAIRGSVSNERAVALAGYSPGLLGSVAAVLSSVAVTVVACLAASATGLDASTYSLYIVPALAILLLARLGSTGVICLAGLVLGAFQAILLFLMSKTWWPGWGDNGLSDAVPFLVIVIVLFTFGKKLPARGRVVMGSLPEVRLPRFNRITFLVIVGLTAVALIVTSGTYRFGLITSLCLMLLALSYVVITGYVGQISLAQISLAGAAGFALSQFGQTHGFVFPLNFIVASVVGSALGLLIAIPALRIRGAQLAIATLAGGIAIQEFVFGNSALTSSNDNPVSGPNLFGLDLSVRNGSDIARIPFGITVLVIVAVVCLLLMRLVSGQTGRAWLAVRANERSAASCGINVQRTKFIAFAISGFLAGLAGCLISYSRGEMSSTSFTVETGLQILAVAYVGGISSIGGAAVAGLLGPLGLVYVVLNAHIAFGQYYPIVAGLGLLVAALFNPEGIAGKTADQIAWLRSKLTGGRRSANVLEPAVREVTDVRQ
jgi:branched-chain amino acid transport system permease protein